MLKIHADAEHRSLRKDGNCLLCWRTAFISNTGTPFLFASNNNLQPKYFDVVAIKIKKPDKFKICQAFFIKMRLPTQTWTR
jgi:hypothetical protein